MQQRARNREPGLWLCSKELDCIGSLGERGFTINLISLLRLGHPTIPRLARPDPPDGRYRWVPRSLYTRSPGRDTTAFPPKPSPSSPLAHRRRQSSRTQSTEQVRQGSRLCHRPPARPSGVHRRPTRGALRATLHFLAAPAQACHNCTANICSRRIQTSHLG